MAENNSEQESVATDTPVEETGSPEAEETAESTPEPTEDQPKETNILEKVDQLDVDEATKEELKKGYMRQSDYTRKTQSLAELKKSMTPPAEPPVQSDDAAMNMLDNYLEQKLSPVADRVALAEFAVAHPDASEYEKEMVDIVQEFPQLGSMSNLNVIYELAQSRRSSERVKDARVEGAKEALKKIEQKGKAKGESPAPRQSGGVTDDDLSKMSASDIKDLLS